MSEVLGTGPDDSCDGERPLGETLSSGQEETAKHQIRKIKLPNGQPLTIRYLDSEEHPPLPKVTPREVPVKPELHICPECTSDTVYPLTSVEKKSQWSLHLRCPNCEWQQKIECDDETVEEFDGVLNDHNEQLDKKLMEYDVEQIIAAIKNDHILPMDF